MLPVKLLLVALLVLATTADATGRQESPSSEAPGPWRPAPEYVRLFAPVGDRAAWYRAYVSSQGLDDVLQRLSKDLRLLHPPGAWMPAALLPLDAFGLTGRFDRNKLTRVYGARRARVARGPFGVDGHADQAWMLVSPYPDPDFAYLREGTLLLTLDLSGR